MYRLFRNIFPFLLIVLFLAPQVTLAVHQFEHSRDFHCDTANSHFHEQEHHCLICDINVTLTSADIYNQQLPQVLFLFTGLLTFHNSYIKFSLEHHFFLLRAPPEMA